MNIFKGPNAKEKKMKENKNVEIEIYLCNITKAYKIRKIIEYSYMYCTIF